MALHRLGSLLLLGAAACAAPRPLDGKSAYSVAPLPLATEWLRSANRVPARSFSLVEGIGKLPAQVRGDSAYWSERFLAPSFRPVEGQRDLVISIHLSNDSSPDLIRYQFRVEKLELTVLESANFTLVRVGGTGILAAPESERGALLTRLAESVLRTKSDTHDWRFGPLEHLGREASFSTNLAADPESMRSWEERADGGIADGVPYFFLFKKNPARVGYMNAQHWFEDEFRKQFRIF